MFNSTLMALVAKEKYAAQTRAAEKIWRQSLLLEQPTKNAQRPQVLHWLEQHLPRWRQRLHPTPTVAVRQSGDPQVSCC